MMNYQVPACQLMHSMAKSVPPKPPPFGSTYNTLNHNRSTRADSPMNVKVKGVVKNPIKFKLAQYHVVILIIALVMMAALVLCLILSFVAIAGNSVLKQLSDSNTMLQRLNDSNTMLQRKLATLHNQTQQLSDFNTMLQQQLTTVGSFPLPASSCAALPPSSPSGYYWVRVFDGSECVL